MNKLIFTTAFLSGLGALAWMGSSFIGTDFLALAVTGTIAAVYLLGFLELFNYRQATATLNTALAAVDDVDGQPDALKGWLTRLDPSLRNAVSSRIQGDRTGLPAPVFTPYLVGLLVMLGLLGTFVGMVETLGGAVAALEGTTELEAIRNGLAAPIRGLGLAFGTSVAGVATSAMLGLVSTLCRRERIHATRSLDNHINGVLQPYSHSYNRQQTYQALQSQAQALPEVTQRLEQLAASLDSMGEHLGNTLLANQQQFHSDTSQTYTKLAESVDRSLQASLGESGRLAGESITPVIAGAMASISENLEASNNSMKTSFDKASTDWIERQESGDQQRLERWTSALEQHQQQTTGRLEETSAAFERLLSASEELVQARVSSESGWLELQDQRLNELVAAISTEISGIRQAEQQREQATVENLGKLEGTVAEHLASLGQALEEPMTRLITTASETPRAAAEVIGELRKEIANNVARDNALLAERQQIMADLGVLFSAQDKALQAQQESINSLVSSSSDTLQEIGASFSEQVSAQVTELSGMTAEFAGSASEISSLSEAFGLGVELFSDTNRTLVEQLERIQEALDKSGSRSDEQMGYYVAQAREVIDHSLQSQREIIEQMRQLSRQQDFVPAEAS